MTYVLGYAPVAARQGGLRLASMLARSARRPLVVCSVVPAPWFPSMARVDTEFRESVHQQADQALAKAEALLPTDIDATFVRHSARSVPTGLLEVAAERDASLVVLGSATNGVMGRISFGSVTDSLLHSSPLPVAVAPRGLRTKPAAVVRRVTAAYGGSPGSDDLALAAAVLAAQVGASFRLASFAVWSRPAYTTQLGADADEAVLSTWIGELESRGQAILSQVRERASTPPDVEAVIGHGEDWPEALDDIDWHDEDLLIVGSTSRIAERVFLGSRSSKILRHSPVPVVALPPTATDEILTAPAAGS